MRATIHPLASMLTTVLWTLVSILALGRIVALILPPFCVLYAPIPTSNALPSPLPPLPPNPILPHAPPPPPPHHHHPITRPSVSVVDVRLGLSAAPGAVGPALSRRPGAAPRPSLIAPDPHRSARILFTVCSQ